MTRLGDLRCAPGDRWVPAQVVGFPDAAFPRQCDVLLPATPANVGVARRMIAGVLDAADAGGVGDSALLCATELLSNVLRHTACAQLHFRLSVEVDSVWLAVLDDSLEQPAAALPDQHGERGRGMHIIDRLAADWGVEPMADGGKAVWLRLV